jgi:hypothetical protein
VSRIHLIALLPILLIAPASAQIKAPPTAPPPTVTAPKPVQGKIVAPSATTTVHANPNTQLNPTATPETARKEIERLNEEIRELSGRLNSTTTRLDKALEDLRQWTTRGGSLVHAYCEPPANPKAPIEFSTVSRNSAGEREDCGVYTCSPVEGTCRQSCIASSQCHDGYVCNPNTNHCEMNTINPG